MSNVVQFLEALARDSKPLSAEHVAAAVMGAGLDPAAQQAILDRDTASLSRVLGGRTTVLCFIAPAENDEPQSDEPHKDEPQEDQPESPTNEPASRVA